MGSIECTPNVSRNKMKPLVPFTTEGNDWGHKNGRVHNDVEEVSLHAQTVCRSAIVRRNRESHSQHFLAMRENATPCEVAKSRDNWLWYHKHVMTV